MVSLCIYSTRSNQVRFITILGMLIKLTLFTIGQIFLKTFFPYTTISWNKADLDVCKSKSYVIFRNTLLKLGRFNQCAIYSISSPVGLKVFTRLRLGLNHLNEHRINQNFKTTLTFV